MLRLAIVGCAKVADEQVQNSGFVTRLALMRFWHHIYLRNLASIGMPLALDTRTLSLRLCATYVPLKESNLVDLVISEHYTAHLFLRSSASKQARAGLFSGLPKVASRPVKTFPANRIESVADHIKRSTVIIIWILTR